MSDNKWPPGTGDTKYGRRGEEKPVEGVIKPDAAKAEVPKPVEFDIGHLKQCEKQLKAILKAWDGHLHAGLSWTDVHSILRPIIEKPTKEF